MKDRSSVFLPLPDFTARPMAQLTGTKTLRETGSLPTTFFHFQRHQVCDARNNGISANGIAGQRIGRRQVHHRVPLFYSYADDSEQEHATHIYVRHGVKPFAHCSIDCRWLPFMSVNRCATEIVDAILKERIIAYMPFYIGLIANAKVFVRSSIGLIAFCPFADLWEST